MAMGDQLAWSASDRQAVLLATLGMSNKMIIGHTGLSIGQISYRMKALGMATSRKDYRNGEGEFAEAVLASRNLLTRPTSAIEGKVRLLAMVKQPQAKAAKPATK